MQLNGNMPTTIQMIAPNGIAFDLKTITQLFCVYEHWVNTPSGPQCVYVGHCRLKDVYLCPDARRNNAWSALITDDMQVELRLIATAQHEYECTMLALNLIAKSNAYCNRYGSAYAGKTIITCITTGRQYTSATEAATGEGVSASALSYHLNGRVGYKSVKGKTFKRGI